jgi:hypothetical protein
VNSAAVAIPSFTTLSCNLEEVLVDATNLFLKACESPAKVEFNRDEGMSMGLSFGGGAVVNKTVVVGTSAGIDNGGTVWLF